MIANLPLNVSYLASNKHIIVYSVFQMMVQNFEVLVPDAPFPSLPLVVKFGNAGKRTSTG